MQFQSFSSQLLEYQLQVVNSALLIRQAHQAGQPVYGTFLRNTELSFKVFQICIFSNYLRLTSLGKMILAATTSNAFGNNEQPNQPECSV